MSEPIKSVSSQDVGKINILIIAPYFAPFEAVASFRMTSLAKSLTEKGANVHVLCSNEKYCKVPHVHSSIPKGLKITALDFNPESYFAIPVYYRAASSILEKGNIDIAIFTVGPFWANFYLPFLKKRLNFPMILDLRDLWIEPDFYATDLKTKLKVIFYKKPISWFIEKRAFKSADKIVTVSKTTCREITQFYKELKDKFEIIENGYTGVVEESDLTKKIASEKILKIGLAEKYARYDKNAPIMLFEAIEELKNRGIPACLYHIGDKESSFMDVQNPSLFNHLKELGAHPHNESLGILGKMDCCVLVYNSPYVGTKIYDYMMLKKPIVAITKENGDIPEILEKYGNGFLCYNREDFINAFMEILQKKSKPFNDDLIRYYSRDNANERYFNLIQSCIKDNPH